MCAHGCLSGPKPAAPGPPNPGYESHWSTVGALSNISGMRIGALDPASGVGNPLNTEPLAKLKQQEG